MNGRLVEGVPYRRYRVRFRLNDGRRRQRTIWSPGLPWLRSEITRMLDEIGDVSTTAPVTIAVQ